ncbi:MAG: acetoacetate--CoA ligase [Litorivicinus sp.]
MTAPLYTPSADTCDHSAMQAFANRLGLSGYSELHRYSVENPGPFWRAWIEYLSIPTQGSLDPAMPPADHMREQDWFPELTLNFAQACLNPRFKGTAFVEFKENGERREVSREELTLQVGSLAAWLSARGVVEGDVVAGFLPNGGDAILAMLATASLGAIWTSCSPDFGTSGVLDRFGQTRPKVLFCVDQYYYNGKTHDAWQKIQSICDQLDSLEHLVCVPYAGTRPDLSASVTPAHSLQDTLSDPQTPNYQQVKFRAPLFVLYSSGTTGAPKCIIHSAGGALVQLTKEHQLHGDIKPGDRLFYYTTLGWMMWNWLATGLASGAALMLYDGSPFYPQADSLVTLAQREGFTQFGTSAKYIAALEKAEVSPKTLGSFDQLRAIFSTGSPLAHESFEYVYREWKSDVLLGSISGGTDIVSCFVLSNPTAAVHIGEIQAAGLGMDVRIVDESGRELGPGDGKGELICATAFPSMPVGFWNDPDGQRYQSAYFDSFDGIWAHGDFAEITQNGGYIIHGRSDATLNPGGVRIGTAEIYRQVERVESVLECLAIGQRWQDDVRVVLFVVLREGCVLNAELEQQIRYEIRTQTTPRHVPARIVQVPELPRTRSGKLVELAVRSVVHNESVANTEALANPDALAYFKDIPQLQE